jgi:hypothetical protein
MSAAPSLREGHADTTRVMDLPHNVGEGLRARGYELDGVRFRTRRPDRLTVGLVDPSGAAMVGKLFPAGGGEVAFQNMLALWRSSFGERRDPPGLARPIEYLPDLGLLVMENLGGRPLVESDYLSERALLAAAELLAALHASDAALGTRPRSAPRIIRSLRRKEARVAELAPDYTGRYGEAVDAVERALPDDSELVCCHGDYSPRNVLAAPDRYALIDWDRLRLADPARDIAHFGAWCWLRSLHHHGVPDWSALDRFLDAYLSRRPGASIEEGLDFHLAAALLRMVAARVELWREESYLIPQLMDEAVRLVR